MANEHLSDDAAVPTSSTYLDMRRPVIRPTSSEYANTQCTTAYPENLEKKAKADEDETINKTRRTIILIKKKRKQRDNEAVENSP